MTNTFLQINYDLFKLGLNPTETMLLAKIMEFHRSTGICYMTNEQFADLFNISESTVDRALKAIEK